MGECCWSRRLLGSDGRTLFRANRSRRSPGSWGSRGTRFVGCCAPRRPRSSRRCSKGEACPDDFLRCGRSPVFVPGGHPLDDTHPRAVHDLRSPVTGGAQQDSGGPPEVLLRTIAVRLIATRRSRSHAVKSNVRIAPIPTPNPAGESRSDSCVRLSPLGPPAGAGAGARHGGVIRLILGERRSSRSGAPRRKCS